jgi:DNA-binding transcriptional MerR regulator
MTPRQQQGADWTDDRVSTARYTLVAARRAERDRLSLDDVAVRSGIHPQLVRRFVALSLVEASRDEAGRLWFDARVPATIARVQRLRTGLGLNYAAIGLVLDLLDRIEQLEAALRRGGYPSKEQTPWT